MFLLDTNVISNLRRRDHARPRLRDWIDARQRAELFISVVTVLEIELGAQLKIRKDAVQGATLISWLHQDILPNFADRIVPVDTEVALRCASLHVPDPKPERDALIAATAMIRGFTLVTRNVRDFQGTGVLLFNPWDES